MNNKYITENNCINYLYENNINKVFFYHGSTIQNIKILKTHYDDVKEHDLNKNVLFMTPYKRYAATYTFKYDDNTLYNDRWSPDIFTLLITNDIVEELKNSCSIYKIKPNLNSINKLSKNKNQHWEYYTVNDQIVFTEYKYQSVLKCLIEHNISIGLVDQIHIKHLSNFDNYNKIYPYYKKIKNDIKWINKSNKTIFNKI